MSNDQPILLLQWLGTSEYKETESAYQNFADKYRIKHANVQSKDDAIYAIEKWLKKNGNAQFLYIGTHGNETGIGVNELNMVSWLELWNVLKKADNPISLWLGACHSSCAAKAWSPVKEPALVDYIVGFPIPIQTREIKNVLRELLNMASINPITFVDEEIPILREAVPSTSVEMYYKAQTKSGLIQYVNVDEFPQIVGLTLKKYLIDKNSDH